MNFINAVTTCPFAFSRTTSSKCDVNCILRENKECKFALALEKIIETKEKESV